MAALTTTEISTIRKQIGDHKTTTVGRQDLTDTEIQAQWDRADGHASEVNGYLARYYMVELRFGIWINATDTETSQGSKSQSQKVAQIEKLMLFYEQKAGIQGAVLRTTQGALDFKLDQDDPETGENLEHF